MAKSNLVEQPPDFSLVLGGPIFQLLQKSRLAGDGLELLYRRLLVITMVAWLPLLLLTTLGFSGGSGGRLSFFHDVEVHVRFLVALPILIAAELIVHLRLRPVVRAFVKRNIVAVEEMPKFHAAINSAKRWRDSIPLELALLIFVCTVGPWLWRSQIALGT